MKTDKHTRSSDMEKNHRASDGQNTDYLTVASADTERLRRARARVRLRKQQKRRRLVLAGLLLCLVLILVFFLVRCVGRTDEEVTQISTEANQTTSLRSLPEGWKWQQMTETDLSQGTLILVNRDHAYDPELPQTVSVFDKKTRSYFVKDKLLSLRESAVDALKISGWMPSPRRAEKPTSISSPAGAAMIRRSVCTKTP